MTFLAFFLRTKNYSFKNQIYTRFNTLNSLKHLSIKRILFLIYELSLIFTEGYGFFVRHKFFMFEAFQIDLHFSLGLQIRLNLSYQFSLLIPFLISDKNFHPKVNYEGKFVLLKLGLFHGHQLFQAYCYSQWAGLVSLPSPNNKIKILLF